MICIPLYLVILSVCGAARLAVALPVMPDTIESAMAQPGQQNLSHSHDPSGLLHDAECDREMIEPPCAVFTGTPADGSIGVCYEAR